MSASKLLNRELYIIGEPIKTNLGEVRFLTYKEYLLHMSDLSAMNMNVLHIYYEFIKVTNKKDVKALEELEELRYRDLFEIVRSIPNILDSYLKVFSLVLDDDEMIIRVFDNAETFMAFRELVLDMQVMIESEVSPNGEIQKGIERSRNMKLKDGEAQTTPTDIITSIVAGTSNSFKDVYAMTVFQAYSVFYRFSAIKSYDTETLFATVNNEVKISPWSRNIDLFKKEDGSSIKRSVFDENTNALF